MKRDARSAETTRACHVLFTRHSTERCHKKEKRLAARSAASLRNQPKFRLETELHAELHLTCVQSASRLTEVANRLEIIDPRSIRIRTRGSVFIVGPATGSCQNKVCPIEYVEGIGVELHTDSLGQFEDLGQCHICEPVPWTDKRVAAQAPGTARARRREVRERESRVVKSIGPSAVRAGSVATDRGVRPIILSGVQVEVAPKVETSAAVDIRHTAMRESVRLS